MTYYQPYVPNAGAGRSPGLGYPRLSSPGYITNPAGQQYMSIQPAFFPPQNLQGTYARVSPPQPQRIELNPHAAAYQSFTSPSPPPGHNAQQYPGGGDQRYQGGNLSYQGGNHSNQGCSLSYQGGNHSNQGGNLSYQGGDLSYQGGNQINQGGNQSGYQAETGQVYPERTKLFRPNVPPPPLGDQGSSIQSTKRETTNGLTLSYPDDQSMFVKDSGQGLAVPSAEDVFKAKASLYGIEICNKAENVANARRRKPLTVLHGNCDSSKFSNGSDEINAGKASEMLFQMTHIDPEHSNDSDDSITTPCLTEVNTVCTTVPQTSIQDCDTTSGLNKTAPNKNLSSSDDEVPEPFFHKQNMFPSEEISNQYLINPVELNGCVVYSETAEHESEDKNNSIAIPVNSWSKGSCANSLDSVGECDSFFTARDMSSASDGEIGIFGNYVLEALMSAKSPKPKKNYVVQKSSDFPALETELYTHDTEALDRWHGDTFESLVEDYVKTIIKKACEVVAKQGYSSGECSSVVQKTDGGENIINGYDDTDSEKLDCVKVGNLDLGENLEKFKHQDEANDTRVKHLNKAADTKTKHQINGTDSKAPYQDGLADQISELSEASSGSSSWTLAWNGSSNSKDENSNFCNNNVIKAKRFHHDSESTEHSSDYSDSGSASQLNPISPEFKPRRYLKNKTSSFNICSMRPDAPVFQPLNVQTLPLSVKGLLREGCCQTEDKEYKEVASNTRRVKQVDRVCETVSCDTREVCVNTMESCFSEDDDYFVPMEATYSEQGTLTESLDKKSIGVLVKPHALDACTVNKETMTEPVTDYLESLIATQRELLHLRGNVCAMELKQQIQELERSKQLFQNMRGEPLDNVIDSRITSLKIELNIIQNQVMSYDAHLLAGNVWKTVPQFTVSIPVGSQSIIAVNKHLNHKSTVQSGGTKRSFWDAHSPEEENLLRGLGTNRPAKMSSKVHNQYPTPDQGQKSREIQNHHPTPGESQKTRPAFQIKPPQTFSFTSTKCFESDPSVDSTELTKATEDKVKESRKQVQTTCEKVKTEVTDVTNPKTDQAPVIHMDNIDGDVSLPELSKTLPLKPPYNSDNTAPSGSDPVSDHVKKEISVKTENYTTGQKLSKGGSSTALETVPVSQALDDCPVSVSKDSGKLSSSEALLASASSGITAFSTSYSVTQNSKVTKVSSGPTTVTATQNSNFATFSNVPAIVTQTQSSSITTFSNGPTTVCSQLGPVPVMTHIPASFCNTTNSGSIITSQMPTFSRQNVASVQLAPLMTGPPLMATPRIISGQQGMVLYPQVHPALPTVTPYFQFRPPQPSVPPYPQVRQMQPSLLPYSQVLPGQPSVPSYPVMADMRTPLLPQPPMAKIPSSLYQGNPLYQSTQTGQTSSPSQGGVSSTIGQIKTSSVPSQTKPSVPPGHTSNPHGQMISTPGQVNSMMVPEQRIASSPVLESVPSQTKSSVPPPGHALNPHGQMLGTTGQVNSTMVPGQSISGQVNSTLVPGQSIPGQVNSTMVPGQRIGSSAAVSSSNASSCPPVTTSQPSGTLDQPSVDPELFQAVIMQLRQAYPHLATDPEWLETVGVQQTRVLQNYIDASKNVAPNKVDEKTFQQVPNSDSNNSNIDSQKREDSSTLTSNSKMPNGNFSQTEAILKQQSVVDDQLCVMNNTTVVPRQPPGLARLTDTDQLLSEKFENLPEVSMKDHGGGAKGLVKTISDLTKKTGNESSYISPNEKTEDSRTVVHKSPIENKNSQKPKSLLDNFKRVDKPVVHEPRVSTLYPNSFEKQEYSTSKDTDLNIPSNLAHNRPKSIPSRQVLISESDKANREAFRTPTPNSTGGENWEEDVDPDPKPFRHDFRKVRPAEKTKTSWLSEMSKTNLPPGLSSKKPTDQSTAGKNDWWDAPKLSQAPSGSNIACTVSYSQKVEKWLNLNQPSSNDVLVRNKSPDDSGTGGQSGSLYSSRGESIPRGDVNNLDDFGLPDDVGDGLSKEGTSGMSVIPLTSKARKTASDLDNISDGEGENWHQVGKKKKEKKKTEAAHERPRRKSGSDVAGKSNNFEKLITKMSEVFSTLNRERIIQLITEVRNETKGLSGMNMKQIIDMSRQIFIAKRHYYQMDPKQKHPSGGSATPKSQKGHKAVPLPIVGMTAMPGPGKTFNFKPLSMSVIQPSTDVPLIDDEEEICVICHDALVMEETKMLECGHIFHSSCIKQWVFGQERTCPNCRRLALFPEEFPRLGK